jgi:hypothetical protein
VGRYLLFVRGFVKASTYFHFCVHLRVPVAVPVSVLVSVLALAPVAVARPVLLVAGVCVRIAFACPRELPAAPGRT